MRSSVITNNIHKKIVVPTTSGMLFIDMIDVVFIEADNVFSILHRQDSTQLRITSSLKALEGDIVGEDFIRIHRQYIVPVNQIKLFSLRDGGFVELFNGKRLPVSRTRKEAFERSIGIK